MTFENKLAEICGVQKQTIDKWYREKNFPEYGKVIRNHLWDGKIYYEGWEDFKFNGISVTNIKTGHYITKEEINMLWVKRQQLDYMYKNLVKKNLKFELKLSKV